MDSRPKRASKKSAKLLSYEQENFERHIFSKKSSKKSDVPESVGPSKKVKPAIPKLKIKFSGFHAATLEERVSTAHASEGHSSVVESKSKKRKHSDTKNVGKPPKKAKARKLQQPLLPTDVEIEADTALDLLVNTSTDNAANIDSFVPEEEIVVPPVDKQQQAVGSAGKRQRKLPAKFEGDDYDVEADMQSNKAAKFFETKKAERKAATAIAKHKESKSGKKTKRNRMPTAYTMWCNSYRAKLQAQGTGMDFVSMNKKLGEVWWSIPPKEKNQWKIKAKRLGTRGHPKNADSLKYLGSRALASLERNNVPITKAVKPKPDNASRIANLNPVYKVTQTEPVDIAAHFEVMSETFKTIGTGLARSGDVKVQGSLAMLLDGLLCGVSSLLALTQQVNELNGDIDPETHRQRMADVAYFIPDI